MSFGPGVKCSAATTMPVEPVSMPKRTGRLPRSFSQTCGHAIHRDRPVGEGDVERLQPAILRRRVLGLRMM